jgi:lysophospholipase L1-like esterase
VTAIVFGDSYVAGVGANSTQDAFPEKAISELRWKVTYFGRAASGYCTSHPVDYLQRLKSLRAGPAPTVFLLEGGINDVGCDPSALRAQISASIAQINAVYPHAALILLGPAVPSKYKADQLLPVDQALTAAATAAGVPYISPLTENWFTDANRPGYMSPDGVNPNQAGHAYLTTLLLRDLEQITGT